MPNNENILKLMRDYMPRLLGYVRDRDKNFTKLIKGLHDYITFSSANTSYIVHEHNKPAQQINTETDIAYLKQLINRLGISLSYFPTDGLLTEEEEKGLYLTAIRGAVVGRTGNTTKKQLLDVLWEMYDTATSIDIIDGGMPENSESIMTVSVTIHGITTSIDGAVLALYLKQDITGVREQFNFDINKTFVFAPVDESFDGSTQFSTIQTREELKTYFTNPDSKYKPYGYNVNEPTGIGGYFWSNVTSLNPDTGEIVEEDYNLQTSEPNYYNTGYWLISLI